MTEQIKVEQLLSSDLALFDNYVKKLQAIESAYTSFIDSVINNGKKIDESQSKLIGRIGLLEKSLKDSNITTQAAQKASVELTTAVNNEVAAFDANNKKQKENTEIGKALANEKSKVSTSIKELQKVQQSNLSLQEKLNISDSKSAKKQAELRLLITEKNKALKQQAQESLNLVDAYQKETQKLETLRKAYKAVAIQSGVNSAESRKLRTELNNLDSKIKQIDASAGQYQRNVGQYGLALKGFTNIARQAASALGFAGVLFALVGIVKNAFNAIKEFDKELVNMAAIAGKNRSELSGLEKVIRFVAKTSINTANEVAKTATALFTLGKSEGEIKKLLKPVNDLSIALQAPANEAGELLIQTLNAFGKSSDSAQEYADIIAKMRTSTALDFERIKDSLGFLAPVARVVGLDFAKTGAVLGVLVDNGIKAARAGRLMSSSFLRLSELGITLDQALTELNETKATTTDELIIAKKASELFGVESAALGLILADNIAKTNLYAESFRNAGGTLDELTKKQLKSLSAQIDILNSGWQEFVFSLENGQGFFSQIASGFISAFGDFITLLTAFNDGVISSGELIVALKDPLVSAVTLAKIKGAELAKIAEEERKQKSILTQAQYLYNEAVQNGAENWSDYEKRFASAIDSNINKTEILAGIQTLYSDNVKKQTEEELKKSLELQAAQDALNEKRQTQIEFYEKYGKVSRKVAKDIEVDNTVNLPKSLDAYVSKTEEVTNKLAFYWKQFSKEIELALNTAFDVASIAVNQFFDNQSIRRDNAFARFEEINQTEIDRLEARRERELNNEDLTAQQKEAINRRYESSINSIEERIDNQRLKNQRKQAKAAKAQALFNIALNTAQGVTAALATLNIPLSIAIGITGGVQLAAAASQPLPAYFKGTEHSKLGKAIVGELGAEIIAKPDGSVSIANEPQVVDLPAGSKVLNHVITRNILEKTKDLNKIDSSIDFNVSENDKLNNLNPTQAKLINTLIKNQKAENDYLASEFHSAIKSLPEIHQFKFGVLGLSRDRKRGSHTDKAVRTENDW